MMKILICLIAVVAISHHRLAAQPNFRLSYITEIQTDFKGGSNWLNLFRADVSQSVGKAFTLELASISFVKTQEESLANDLLTFSNIEEVNLPLAIALLGMRWDCGKSSLFLGIRNVNEDYFTSPCTSLFTNSSCGIFPTLSVNYPIANYPMASVSVNYTFTSDAWMIQTSVYNGVGYNCFSGRENVFRFCPASDGIFNVTSINYRNNGGSYYLGSAFHSRVPVDDAQGTDETTRAAEAEKEARPGEKTKVNVLVWGYAEQRLSSRLHVMAQYSINPSSMKEGCRSYAGAGVVLHARNSELGLFTGYADFKPKYEWVTEITCKIPCLKNGYIQPAFHLIKNSRECNMVGMLRFGYEIR